MTDLNRQRVARNHLIAVTLVRSAGEASVFVKPPSAIGHRRQVDIKPLLAGGLSEGDALDFIARIVEIGIEGTEIQNG